VIEGASVSCLFSAFELSAKNGIVKTGIQQIKTKRAAKIILIAFKQVTAFQLKV
jgi:hypothetical protein